MNKCDQKYLVVDYFFDELNGEQRQQFEDHLTGCNVCEEQLAVLAETSQVVKKYQREQPQKTLLRNYQLQLKSKFNERVPFTSRIDIILEKFVRQPSIAIRLAEAAVFILIGVFIGKTVIWQSSTATVSDEINSVVSQPSVEQLILKNYLQETEMIFLDVANLDPVEDQELIFSLVQSTKYKYLLQKTLLLRDQAKELEDHQLSDVLSQIELILLELYNMENSAYEETLFLIKQQLRDSHLLIEMKTLNQMDI
jgi:hypothetical protein